MRKFITAEDIDAQADFDAEMASGAAEWDAMTAEQQAELIASQDAAAWCDAEWRAEQAMSAGYGWS